MVEHFLGDGIANYFQDATAKFLGEVCFCHLVFQKYFCHDASQKTLQVPHYQNFCYPIPPKNFCPHFLHIFVNMVCLWFHHFMYDLSAHKHFCMFTQRVTSITFLIVGLINGSGNVSRSGSENALGNDCRNCSTNGLGNAPDNCSGKSSGTDLGNSLGNSLATGLAIAQALAMRNCLHNGLAITHTMGTSSYLVT